ncbi:MAG: zinc carboxypeptidase [Actinomycetota bacterium]|nr:zinc carboxypeptidase [Actinomycetota bacterium]
MRRWLVTVLAAAVVSSLIVPVAGADPSRADRLNVYTAVVDAGQFGILVEQGFDVVNQRRQGDAIAVEFVATAPQRAKLTRAGVSSKLTRVKGGQTVQQFAARQAQGGFDVWRSWDEPGGFRDQMYAVARRNPQIAKLVKIGSTVQGREVLAIKLTQGARDVPDGSRPAVLYSSVQHAREWIAGEVNRRLMNWYIDRWRANDKPVKRMLKETELWFVLIANPDGYEYTFDSDRLWRKNLRDNNGDGTIATGDGVDLNRNFPNHFKYDEEGSSSVSSSETYRGPEAVSEPETAAMKGLLDRIGFAFQVNWHSVGEWLLYAEGWQIATPTADDPIYYALSGNLDESAIPGFHPGLSSDVLYVTNGETTDYAHAVTGALAWTPELGDGCPESQCGFVFPDNEQRVQEEFERSLPFAHSVARSATDPDDPKSVLDIETKPFYLKSDDPYKEGIPGANFRFEYSYGDPQPVQVLAKRSLGDVAVHYRINGGGEQTAPTSEWDGGERYAPADVHYRELRGVVEGTDPGDTVEVWFEGGGERSDSFTYEAVSETGSRVLVVAAEDYTGASPRQAPGPHYLDYYLDSLAANGVSADVYDVDARDRTAPDHLGVLSHYDAAIWYTGDDIVTRRTGWGPGNVDRLALDEILEFRAYMNEGGGVLYTGDWAAQQYTGNVGNQLYDPKGEALCNPNPSFDPRRCLLLRGSGDGTNDVLQYYFGGYLSVLGDGLDENGDPFDVDGIDAPFESLSWGLNGPDSANNQDATSSTLATSGILPPDEFPQFESWPSSRYDKPGGPFDPHTGDQYVYSQIADVSYKRLTREIAVPASGDQTLNFWTSYDTEPAWDYLFVEARTAGGEDWTTLPDMNGHTTQATGDSCDAGWSDELHPQLNHYMTYDGTSCTSSGTSGVWHAASGNSGGWVEWEVDLSEWSGETVEVSIAYASDWSVQNLGVFVDDVTLPDGTATSFEDGLGGWAVTGPPEGSGPNANNWVRTDSSGFPVGASITTPDSILMGFGFEGISTQAERDAVMGRALSHLLE